VKNAKPQADSSTNRDCSPLAVSHFFINNTLQNLVFWSVVMVVGYHLIWTAYGWWLPNDLRGSSSHVIHQNIIAQLGELHFGRKRVQPASSQIRAFYAKAKNVLKFDLLKFTARDVTAISQAFASIIKRESYTCYACAIMPDHVHLVIRKHRHRAEDMIAHFQTESRNAVLQLNERDPLHPVWGGPGWKVYLEDQQDFERTIKYIENNPIKEDRPQQAFGFVTPYDGWMPGLVSRVRPEVRNRKQEVRG